MSMVEITKRNGVTFVRIVKDKILKKEDVSQLGDELSSIPEGDMEKIVLSFSGVEYISSAVLNKFILFDRCVKRSGGRLRLCEMQPGIFEVFIITRINSMFAIDASEDEAIRSFYL